MMSASGHKAARNRSLLNAFYSNLAVLPNQSCIKLLQTKHPAAVASRLKVRLVKHGRLLLRGSHRKHNTASAFVAVDIHHSSEQKTVIFCTFSSRKPTSQRPAVVWKTTHAVWRLEPDCVRDDDGLASLWKQRFSVWLHCKHTNQLFFCWISWQSSCSGSVCSPSITPR